MVVKVCGMREATNIRSVEALGIDLMGFIFWEKSKRNVYRIPDYLPKHCKRVGVFVNASKEEILRKVSEFSLHFIQLHGNESPGFLLDLRQSLVSQGLQDVGIIRMVAVHSENDARQAAEWDGIADLLLFETPSTGFGGSGHSFNWNSLSAYHGVTPFLLSGGIGMGSLENLRAFHHPKWLGIDLNSRFELSPSVKDVEQLQIFLNHFYTFSEK